MNRVFSYCIHRTLDDQEVAVPIPNVETFLHQRTLARWRAMPLRKRLTEASVAEAISGALDEAAEVVRVASHRL
jgi:hypothetical protein